MDPGLPHTTLGDSYHLRGQGRGGCVGSLGFPVPPHGQQPPHWVSVNPSRGSLLAHRHMENVGLREWPRCNQGVGLGVPDPPLPSVFCISLLTAGVWLHPQDPAQDPSVIHSICVFCVSFLFLNSFS